MKDTEELKCFEYLCPRYPDCGTAGGSSCAVDDFFEGRTLTKEQCFDLEEKSFFRERKKSWFTFRS